ncbi:hypothetical protein E2C01_037504 [Portunus trituberculatus]|uniref:Uncharacterized protein n=1 Tax=Portunus trituberculatus TaxID=210409 RepID=A0A5B7F8A9_PORTR|nr:hypothetical protein [Portunus trituberculatus]
MQLQQIQLKRFKGSLQRYLWATQRTLQQLTEGRKRSCTWRATAGDCCAGVTQYRSRASQRRAASQRVQPSARQRCVRLVTQGAWRGVAWRGVGLCVVFVAVQCSLFFTSKSRTAVNTVYCCEHNSRTHQDE